MTINRTITVAMIGLEPIMGRYFEGISFVHLIDGDDTSASGKEKLWFLERLGSISDIVVVNLSNPLRDYETILLYVAYTNHIPIIGVGEPIACSDIVFSLISNGFSNVEEALNHIVDLYVR